MAVEHEKDNILWSAEKWKENRFTEIQIKTEKLLAGKTDRKGLFGM